MRKMKLKELLENWIVDIISSALGVTLISFAFEIKAENPYWWIAFLSGILFNLPTIYFQIWKYIKELLESWGFEIS